MQALVALAVALVPATGFGGPKQASPTAIALENEGLRAFKEGRCDDAIRFFYSALRAGGSPDALVPIAQCHISAGRFEDASNVLEQYIAQLSIKETDRLRARAQLEELRGRPSSVSFSTQPPGATVIVDGRRDLAAATPATLQVPPGNHAVTFELGGYLPVTREFVTRFGRPVNVGAELSQAQPSASERQPATETAAVEEGRVGLLAEAGPVLPKYGQVGESPNLGLGLRGTYRLLDGPFPVAAGLRVSVIHDGWSDTIGAARDHPTCSAPLPTDFSATAVNVFGTVVASKRINRFGAALEAGVGLSSLLVSEVGGDVFKPTCNPSPGVRPALHLGLEVFFVLARPVRIIASPFWLDASTAFAGARDTPVSATGLWLRFGFMLGVGFDL